MPAVSRSAYLFTLIATLLACSIALFAAPVNPTVVIYDGTAGGSSTVFPFATVHTIEVQVKANTGAACSFMPLSIYCGATKLGVTTTPLKNGAGDQYNCRFTSNLINAPIEGEGPGVVNYPITAVLDAGSSGSTSWASSKSNSLRVMTQPPRFTVAGLSNPSVPFGKPIIVTASLSPAQPNPDGTVLTLFSRANGKETSLANGSVARAQAQFTLTLPVGNYPLFLGVSSSANPGQHAALTQSISTLNVQSSNSSTVLEFVCNDTPARVTSNMAIKATIPFPRVSGKVMFYSGSTQLGEATLSNGIAQWVIGPGSLVPGTYTFTAKYEGDSNYKASTSPAMTIQLAPRMNMGPAGPPVPAPNPGKSKSQQKM